LNLRQIFIIPASDADFQNVGLLPASAKLAVKYRPSDNPRHMQEITFGQQYFKR